MYLKLCTKQSQKVGLFLINFKIFYAYIIQGLFLFFLFGVEIYILYPAYISCTSQGGGTHNVYAGTSQGGGTHNVECKGSIFAVQFGEPITV